MVGVVMLVGWLLYIFKYLLGGWFGWGCCLFMDYVPLFQTCVCFLEKRAPGGCLGYIGEMILPSYIGNYFINQDIRIPSLSNQYFHGKYTLED